jgi:dTDP-glucose 4,6-dehydratase
MTRMLVTGGMGFIGSNFILYMLNKYPSYQIVNIDLLTYAGNRENLSGIDTLPNYQFVQGDITNRTTVDTVMNLDIDIVVHFAAESHVDRSIDDPFPFVDTNVIGTYQLLESARKHRIKKFIQISTDEVYGSLGSTGHFTEQSSIIPNSPYSASKAGADMLAHSYYITYQFPVVITRCSNNYGPYQFPEKLIPLTIIHALGNKDIPIYGDGLNVRDWLFVEDHCSAIDLVIQKGSVGEAYNVGGNNEHSNVELVRRILSELGKPESLMKFVKDRPGHDQRYALDAAKIRNELGWEPTYHFDHGIKETVDWYVQNKGWWQKSKGGDDG